jgi:hypothetical protein
VLEQTTRRTREVSLIPERYLKAAIMFKPKISLSKEAYEKIRLAAEVSGCASVEEFAAGILTSEADRILTQAGKQDLSASEVEDIAQKLKGLGYLD